MDVKTAFLNGRLKEEVYTKIPEITKSEKNQICKSNKAFYRLKQARCWFEEFEKYLKEKDFENSPVDRCIYILDKGDASIVRYLCCFIRW